MCTSTDIIISAISRRYLGGISATSRLELALLAQPRELAEEHEPRRAERLGRTYIMRHNGAPVTTR